MIGILSALKNPTRKARAAACVALFLATPVVALATTSAPAGAAAVKPATVYCHDLTTYNTTSVYSLSDIKDMNHIKYCDTGSTLTSIQANGALVYYPPGWTGGTCRDNYSLLQYTWNGVVHGGIRVHFHYWLRGPVNRDGTAPWITMTQDLFGHYNGSHYTGTPGLWGNTQRSNPCA